ncbi:YfhD family protein [Paenibacillus sp. J5C_2022]|uniref:YfhD family protein n=1 Tax=Paenibacillus sp. J5C2022 TaxID=2977129 RepID=UPI0021CE0196|nr:YfhD family protein [Paenibacillus sp. J5C2022]MCU6707655.1 YfhD family protein [Paenibacillus sp. J5C2022]
MVEGKNNIKANATDMENINFAQLPIAKNEDVEFSEEAADNADRIAQQRAEAADRRAQGEQ